MIVLKILAAPFVVVLTVLAAVVSFLFCMATAVFVVACVVLTLLAVALFIIGTVFCYLFILHPAVQWLTDQAGGFAQILPDAKSWVDVIINFEPCDSEQVVFEEKVFGGSVPKNFFPAVEKGVRLAAEKGVLAGYPVVGLKATLLDGSYHPVDSSEMAFIMAAKLAYKAAMPEAGPVILEPIHTLKAHVPNDNTGDIMGDVTKRRGRVLGMEPDEDGLQTIIAEVPLAELANFTTFIRQTTQGRGWFTTEFARYEVLPEMLVPAVVEQAKKLGNLDESADD